MKQPSNRQLEKHIREHSKVSWNVTITVHARQRMKLRKINDPMVYEVLEMGNMSMPAEPDIRHLGLKCRMQRFVAGIQVAVVVSVQYPEPHLIVITVIDVEHD